MQWRTAVTRQVLQFPLSRVVGLCFRAMSSASCSRYDGGPVQLANHKTDWRELYEFLRTVPSDDWNSRCCAEMKAGGPVSGAPYAPVAFSRYHNHREMIRRMRKYFPGVRGRARLDRGKRDMYPSPLEIRFGAWSVYVNCLDAQSEIVASSVARPVPEGHRWHWTGIAVNRVTRATRDVLNSGPIRPVL